MPMQTEVETREAVHRWSNAHPMKCIPGVAPTRVRDSTLLLGHWKGLWECERERGKIKSYRKWGPCVKLFATVRYFRFSY